MAIDYDRMKRVRTKQKAALTRAVNAWLRVKAENNHQTFDNWPVRAAAKKVEDVCRAAVKEWDEIGCWPDDWHRWEIALNDTRPWHDPINLRDL